MMMVWGVQARVSLAYMIPSASRSSKHLAGNAVHKETSVQEGSSATKKGGVSEDVKSMLTCLQKHFPDEVSLDRVWARERRRPWSQQPRSTQSFWRQTSTRICRSCQHRRRCWASAPLRCRMVPSRVPRFCVCKQSVSVALDE